MLDIAETEAGIGALHMEALDLEGIACHATDLFRPVAEDKGVDLSLDAHPVPLVPGDLRRVQRAIANLIDNAIKYTDPGGQVRVSVGRQNDSVCLAVKDTGMGIPAREIPRLFDRFYRGDTSRSQPGSGLGLSLTRAIVRAHGGDIEVESLAGKGSRFTLVMPIRSPGA